LAERWAGNVNKVFEEKRSM